MYKSSFSSIDEPIALTGKIYHKSTLLKSRPYLMLCLPISIDDCSYIYNKLSNLVNFSLDPNAPIFLGHLTIAAINGEALLIILTSKADLLNPSFIHFKNVSHISGNDIKYEITIHSNQKDQDYEFSCKSNVDYDKWLYHLNQAQKITNGEAGRKLRFCSLLFNKECNNKNYIKVKNNEISPIKNSSNDIKNIKNISFNSSDILNSFNSEDGLYKIISHPNRINKNTDDIINDSFNFNYQCCEKYLENYKKEEGKEEKDLKFINNNSKNKNIIEDDFNIFNDTLLKENIVKKKSSQPFTLTKKQSGHFIENDKFIQNINNEILYESNNPFIQDNNLKLNQSSNIEKGPIKTNNEINLLNSTNYNSNKINVVNNPIINNTISVINPNLNAINSNLNPISNSTNSNIYSQNNSMTFPNVQSISTEMSLNNATKTSMLNPPNTKFNFNGTPTQIPVIAPIQIPTPPIPYGLPRHQAFYNPSPPASNGSIEDIPQLNSKMTSEPTTPHSLSRLPVFYQQSSSSPTISNQNLSTPQLNKTFESSAKNSLPRHPALYKKSTSLPNSTNTTNINSKINTNTNSNIITDINTNSSIITDINTNSNINTTIKTYTNNNINNNNNINSNSNNNIINTNTSINTITNTNTNINTNTNTNINNNNNANANATIHTNTNNNANVNVTVNTNTNTNTIYNNSNNNNDTIINTTNNNLLNVEKSQDIEQKYDLYDSPSSNTTSHSRHHIFTKQASASSTTSSIKFNRQYEEQNKSKTLPRTKKSDKKKFQSLPRYNSYKVTITRFKSIFSSNKNKV